MSDIYTENGYRSRRHYLECLADDYAVDLEVVLTLASLYGPNEDFDGLVTDLQDLAEDIWEN